MNFVKINNLKLNFDDINPVYTILQLCLVNSLELPKFCYHEQLSIAGNCRMCLVEVKNSAKLVASCAMPVMPSMQIFTNSFTVKKAREGVLEFLLSNHPLDCPICDQGGECDLQDQAVIFGGDKGRFYEFKRSVENKNLGPLIKTIMTRCIHCTRCVRFSTELGHMGSLGVMGRGKFMEISTYLKKSLISEVSGNLIDLCPVGALTSKPYAFTARPWELKYFKTIDIFDSLGSHINVALRGHKIMRVLPFQNPNLNLDWISDNIRFCYDSLKYQRLLFPCFFFKNQIYTKSWGNILKFISFLSLNLKSNIGNGFMLKGYVGNLVDLETTFEFKKLLSMSGSTEFYNSTLIPANYANFRSSFMVPSLNSILNADTLFFFGLNLRTEFPVLNLRLKSAINSDNSKSIFSIGSSLNLNYIVTHFGNSTKDILNFVEGRHFSCLKLVSSKSPLLLLGNSFLLRKDSFAISTALDSLKNIGSRNLKIFSLISSSNVINSLDLGFVPNVYSTVYTKKNKLFNINYLLGADDSLNLKDLKKSSHFNIYQGHHGDILASSSDLLLPGSTFLEKTSHYHNLFGQCQQTLAVLKSPGLSQLDNKILKNVTKHFLFKLDSSLNTNFDLEDFKSINFISVNLSHVNKSFSKFSNSSITGSLINYYKLNSLTRSSVILNYCASTLYNKSNF